MQCNAKPILVLVVRLRDRVNDITVSQARTRAVAVLQCKAKPISVLVIRLRDRENDIISFTSKNESGDSLAMQVKTNLSLGCKIER